MKKLLKITTLSLALIASIFVLRNVTEAANGVVSLLITGTDGYCVVGYNVPYGATGFSYTGYSITKGFDTTSGGTTWFCDDSEGANAGRKVELAAETIHNVTTNNPDHDIPTTRLHIANDTGTKINGDCTATPGTSLGNPINLGTTAVLFGKASATGEVCKIATENVKMTIDLDASQALGQYSGELTVTIPTWSI